MFASPWNYKLPTTANVQWPLPSLSSLAFGPPVAQAYLVRLATYQQPAGMLRVMQQPGITRSLVAPPWHSHTPSQHPSPRRLGYKSGMREPNLPDSDEILTHFLGKVSWRCLFHAWAELSVSLTGGVARAGQGGCPPWVSSTPGVSSAPLSHW